jgi:signal transduction histidine kinase
MSKSEPIKFLLVDDRPENLLLLEALLRREGLQLLQASSGAEALELLLVHDVALALLDVQMPMMDGFELAELMRGTERTRHVPIIFVTAGSRDARRVFQGYESGAVDFLFKPIDAHILRSKATVFFDLAVERRSAAQTLRLNEMFVGVLGHDLRNPLGVVIVGTGLLRQQITDEAQLTTLRRMTVASQRMKDMIEQLIDLTRARLGGGVGLARSHKALDVADVVRSAVDELRVTNPDGDVVIDAAGDCATFGDRGRLLQVFSNLVDNALRHGSVGARVSVNVIAEEGEIAVEVHNAGLIPAEVMPMIFEPFHSRVGGSTGAGGLGLGLFIAQQIVLGHHGSIAAESSAADGTVVTVRLPRQTS